MKQILLFVLLFLFNKSLSQGLIINEISNGTSGTKEFMEFLVVGSSTQPTGSIDISNWVFDDNNGDFEASTGAGVAAGHYRFTNLTPLVPIGSIIVVYNNGDVNDNMIADDPLDSNNDHVYVYPINSPYLERCTSTPSSTVGTSYTPCTYSSIVTQTWNSIGMRNGGDATQVRKPDYSFYHGFSYGDVLNPYPIFPVEFGSKPSFNVITGSGTGRNYYLDCGDWTEQSNYNRGDAIFDTPGLPNTGNNLNLITNVKMGTFNYDNLGDPVNCAPVILNENSIKFRADKLGKNVEISWDTIKEIREYALEKSNNGYDFDIIYTGFQNRHTDKLELHNYYRLKLIDSSDDFTYTNTIYLEGEKEAQIAIYPRLAYDFIRIETETEIITCFVYSTSGQKVLSATLSDDILKINDLHPGLYFLRIETKEYYRVVKFQKM
jgi:hypothetical protein